MSCLQILAVTWSNLFIDFRNNQERIRLRAIRGTSDPFQIEEEKFGKLFRVAKSGAQQLIECLNVASSSREGIPKHIIVWVS